MNDFFYMDGYYFYVWTSYALSMIVLAANIIAPYRRMKKIRSDMLRKFRREQKNI